MNDQDLIKIIGKNIKKYREQYLLKDATMSKEKLAKLTKIPISDINKLENEILIKNISIKNLYKIATVLETPISKFLEKTNDN